MNSNQMMPFRPAIALALAALLVACGGGETSPSDASYTSSAGNSSSGSCSYTDLITSTERSNANACGIQGSSNFAAADSALQSTIAACQQGEKAIADAYYQDTYTKMVDYARSVYSTVCR